MIMALFLCTKKIVVVAKSAQATISACESSYSYQLALLT